MFFSVLIPAYNVEKYIDKCLSSIKRQLFADFEAIIIDDGSTDRTLQICKEYESCDKRFNVYHQDNVGIVNTRNRLLELAKGEWVTFLDADDYVKDNYLLSFYKCQEANAKADVLVSDYIMWEGGNAFFAVRSAFADKRSYLKMLLDWRKTNTALWGKAIRMELIKNRSLKFESGIVLGEDLCFISRLFYFACEIIHIPVETYVWNRCNIDSITHREVLWGDYIRLYETIYSFYSNQPDYNYFKKTLSNTIVRAMETVYLYSHKGDFGRLPTLIENRDLTIINKVRYFCCMRGHYNLVSFFEKIVRRLS